MKLIPLTQGKFALVDDEDYDYLMQWKWQARKSTYSDTWYALSHERGSHKSILMHRIILRAPNGVRVDHRDRIGLNNQRLNLRLASSNENARNTGMRSHNKSGFKGVSWDKRKGKFQAQIRVNGKTISLGYFHADCILDAARAYNEAAIRLHGEFAYQNVILEDLMCCC
jgi:AP2 domain